MILSHDKVQIEQNTPESENEWSIQWGNVMTMEFETLDEAIEFCQDNKVGYVIKFGKM